MCVGCPSFATAQHPGTGAIAPGIIAQYSSAELKQRVSQCVGDPAPVGLTWVSLSFSTRNIIEAELK